MTTNLPRRLLLGAPFAAAALAAANGSTASAESPASSYYPDRVIRLVATTSPGGGVDVTARMLAPKLASILGEPVIVLNKPGANAIVGTEFAAREPADGYTLLIGSAGPMVVNPAIYTHLPYSTLGDFVPITKFVSYPLLLVVRASSPFKTARDLVTYTRENPHKANFSASNALMWLTMELFKQKTGAKMAKISYKGTMPALLAVVSGEVLCTMSSPFPVSGQLRAGTIRALAVTAPERVPQFPDVPTMKEAGVPDLMATGWLGLWAQRATPSAIIDKLYQAMHHIMASPDIKADMGRMDVVPMATSQKQFASAVSRDLALWKGVAKEAGIKINL